MAISVTEKPRLRACLWFVVPKNLFYLDWQFQNLFDIFLRRACAGSKLGDVRCKTGSGQLTEVEVDVFQKKKEKLIYSSPPRQNAWRKDKSSVHWWFTAASQRHQQNIYKQYLKKNLKFEVSYIVLGEVGTRQTGSSVNLQTHNKRKKQLRLVHKRTATLHGKITLFHSANMFKHCTAEVSPKKRNQVIINRLVECATC